MIESRTGGNEDQIPKALEIATSAQPPKKPAARPRAVPTRAVRVPATTATVRADPAAVDQSGQHVAAEAVGTERVRAGRQAPVGRG